MILLKHCNRNVPVNLAFNNQESLENFAERITTQVEPTKEELLSPF